MISVVAAALAFAGSAMVPRTLPACAPLAALAPHAIRPALLSMSEPPDAVDGEEAGLPAAAPSPPARREKPVSSIGQRIGGVFGILAVLYASGFILNYAFSPASPLLSENREPSMFTDGAVAKYSSMIDSAVQSSAE